MGLTQTPPGSRYLCQLGFFSYFFRAFYSLYLHPSYVASVIGYVMIFLQPCDQNQAWYLCIQLISQSFSPRDKHDRLLVSIDSNGILEFNLSDCHVIDCSIYMTLLLAYKFTSRGVLTLLICTPQHLRKQVRI